jgi:ribosomal protein L37AE/L43A
MSGQDDFSNLLVAIVETSIPNLGEGLVGKTLEEATSILLGRGFELLYESKTSVLNPAQRQLYEQLLSSVPKKITIFLDPIIISFALKDACDLSSADYIWLDLEGRDDLGNMVWTGKAKKDHILTLMNDLILNHLEKYVVDAYDRLTREDMARVWEAQIELKECPVCGSNALTRRLVKRNAQELRSWVCSTCRHHVILPSDTLTFIRTNRSFFVPS